MKPTARSLVFALALTAASCSSDGTEAGSNAEAIPTDDPTGAEAGAGVAVDGERDGGLGSADAGALCVACSDACEEAFAVASASHVEGDLGYDDIPPAGGDHNGCWAPWGVHDTALRPENWVHNLEHGGVVFLYDCADGCDAEVLDLVTLIDGRDQTILSPYPGLGTRFAVVAWGSRLRADCFDLDAMTRFYDAHVDQAPESITAEPPRECP